MKKIEKLTKEQEDHLPVFRDEWLKVGLSTKTVDQDTSTLAVKNLYLAAGMDEPIIMHFQSPWQCIMAINFLQKFGDLSRANLRDKLGGDLRDDLMANIWASLRDNLSDNLRGKLEANFRGKLGANLRDKLGANIRDNLRDNLRDSIRDNLRASIEANIRDNIRANLWANIRANIRDNLWDNIRGNLGENIRANLWDNLWDNSKLIETWFWGGQDANWLAFYEFGEKIGVKYDKADHFHAYIKYAKSSGWGYFYPNIALVSNRPEIIKKDDEARLHCEDGPALKFRDGYSVFCWHGINVPAAWIEDKESLDPVDVLKVENVEQRAAGAAIIGWPKMLTSLDYKIIDYDENPDHGELIELTLPGLPKPGRFLKAECPRNGVIVEGVPYKSDIDNSPINTVLAAQAWRAAETVETFTYPPRRT